MVLLREAISKCKLHFAINRSRPHYGRTIQAGKIGKNGIQVKKEDEKLTFVCVRTLSIKS